MATFFFTSQSSLSSCNLYTQHKKKHDQSFKNVGSSLSAVVSSVDDKNSLNRKTHVSFSVYPGSDPRKPLDLSVLKGHYYLPFSRRLKPLRSSLKDEQEIDSSSSSSSVAVASEEPSHENDTPKGVEEVKPNEESEEKEKQQEMDWKTDDEFKKFMGNPSIEAAIKLEKKRADRKLKELDKESSGNPVVALFNKLVRDNLTREKERLEQAEETFKALDLNKVNFFFSSI